MSSLLSVMAGVISTIRPLLFDIVPATRSGDCNISSPGSCEATSNSATTAVSGGTPPYTYLWTFVSGDSFTITTPTASSTTFSKTNTTTNDPVFDGIYKCTVTDANSNTEEDTVEVSLIYLDF